MTTVASPAAGTGLASLIGRLSTAIRRLTPGPRAELRRLRTDAGDFWRAAAFHRLYLSIIAPDHDGGPEQQRRWAMILSGLARLDHQSGPNIGATLAEHGFSERRLVRLLDADDDHLASELRSAVAFLAGKGASANWINLADLVLSCHSEHPNHDKIRRDIASAYYHILTKKA